MKTIEEILDNYSEYQTFLEDRFGKRLCDFLTVEQAKSIGWHFKEGYQHTPKPWTEENVLSQLQQDVAFGWEKACDERGISASLMYEVVVAWCKVLENGLDIIEYGVYGKDLFESVADKYGWELELDA